MDTVYNLQTDTPLHVMKMQVDIVLKKSSTERLQMCADITEFSLEMLKRQILAKHQNLTEGRLKFEMIKALYADCFCEEELKRVEKHFT